VLLPRPEQTDRPELFLLSRSQEDRGPHGSSAHVRLRLRRWEIRRAWSGRALVAISFPMAYLLIMLAMGTPAPASIVRFLLGLWAAAAAVGAVCAEAVWRNRLRLERMVGERRPGVPG
jgi:hypothetical protein